MSFENNIGKPWIEPGANQCEMVNPHHPDCECASCKAGLDVQCLEPAVGYVPECCNGRVCVACAKAMEIQQFKVVYYQDIDTTLIGKLTPEQRVELEKIQRGETTRGNMKRITIDELTDQKIKTACMNGVARLQDCIVAIGLRPAPGGELIEDSRQRVVDAINRAEYFRIFHRTPWM